MFNVPSFFGFRSNVTSITPNFATTEWQLINFANWNNITTTWN